MFNPNPLALCSHNNGQGRYEFRKVNKQGQQVKNGEAGEVFRRLVQVPCATLGRGQRCPCVPCRQSWARIEAAVRAKSFETKPPTHFAVCKHPTRSPSEFVAIVDRFVRRLRDWQAKLKKQGMELEWSIDIEESTGEPPHLHVLIRANDPLNIYSVDKSPQIISKSQLRLLWVRACADDGASIVIRENIRVYCEPVRSAERAARYTTKCWVEWKGQRWRLVEPWLPGREWDGIKLHRCSDGWYAHKRDLLYAKVKRDWFGDERDDTETLPTWKPPEPDSLDLTPIKESTFRDNSKVIWKAAPDLVATVWTYSPFESGYTLQLNLDTKQREALPSPLKDRIFKIAPDSKSSFIHGVKPSELSLRLEAIPWDSFDAMLERIGKELEQAGVSP